VGLESSVGVVIDGVYRPRNGVGFGDLGEIDRIEVLEGPQGELFGKNNDAGVINIVTKRPSTTFGVLAEASGGNYDDQEISASVTGPLGDISAGRFFFGYQKRNGFLNVNPGLGPYISYDTDDRNVYTARAQYLITPNEAVNFLVIGDYSKRNESCCGAVQTVLGPFAGIVDALVSVPELGGRPGVVGEASAPLSPFNRQAYNNQAITQQVRDMGISGQLNWDLGVGKLTSITAWRDNTIIAGNDIDYTAADIVYEPGNEGNMTDFKQFSEELRFAGKNGPLDWLVGGFFSSEILSRNFALYAGNAFDLYLSGLSSAAGVVPPGSMPPNFLLTAELTGKPPGSLFVPGVSGEADWYHDTSKSYAFFTNETYNITQGLDLTAGLRFTSEKKTADSNYLNPDGGAGCLGLLTSPGLAAQPAATQAFLLGYGCFTGFNPFFSGKSTAQSLTEGNVSGTVKLSYRFTDDVMTYLSWANGYKAGGFNLDRVTQVGPMGQPTLMPNFDTEFPRETVESYELGLKSEWAEKTVRLNGSIFDQQYTNFQLNTFTGVQFVVSSIRRVESKGAELDTDWATPLSGLSLAAGVVYAFTNITEFGGSLPLFAPNDVDATTLPRLNNRLSFAPLWSGVASATYTVPLSGSLQFHANINEKYNSSYNTGSDLDPRKLQAAYGLLNARLGLGAPDGLWTVEIWGNNLADKGFYQVAFDAPFQYNQIDAFLGDPRTFGITVRTKF